ncbi:MAG: metallophosphoesterase [Bacteroidetes bacterium]|nr:metallophosphoesterase [Bacteroidota bacterium]
MAKYLTIISDPHGCHLTFLELAKQIPIEDNRVIVVGDIIDRGPGSLPLFEYIKESKIEMILGNHEHMFLHRKNSPDMMQMWLDNGGNATLASIKSMLNTVDEDKIESVLDDFHKYFSSVKLYIEVQSKSFKLIISHAGISRFYYQSLSGDLQKCFEIDPWDNRSCLWNRDELAVIEDSIQIVGHTPVINGPKKVDKNYYIDSGCVFRHLGYGYLTAMIFDLENEGDPQILKQNNIDD